MGLDITYIASNYQLSFRLSKVDTDIISILAKRNPNDVEVIFGVADFGEETRVKRTDLLDVTERILNRLGNEAPTLFCIYKYRFSAGPLAGVENCGMMGTITINHDGFYYAVDSGVGYCNLIKSGIDRNGMGYDIERIDIRSVGKMKTDNMGELEIYREKKRSSLEKHLKSLKEFLEKQTTDTVIKILG